MRVLQKVCGKVQAKVKFILVRKDLKSIAVFHNLHFKVYISLKTATFQKQVPMCRCSSQLVASVCTQLLHVVRCPAPPFHGHGHLVLCLTGSGLWAVSGQRGAHSVYVQTAGSLAQT